LEAEVFAEVLVPFGIVLVLKVVDSLKWAIKFRDYLAFPIEKSSNRPIKFRNRRVFFQRDEGLTVANQKLPKKKLFSGVLSRNLIGLFEESVSYDNREIAKRNPSSRWKKETFCAKFDGTLENFPIRKARGLRNLIAYLNGLKQTNKKDASWETHERPSDDRSLV
jgi:hypothetical protein